MNNTNIVEALSQIVREKNVGREMVVQTLADALISAAKKRHGETDNYDFELDPDSGQMSVRMRKTVVEEIDDEALEIELDEARAIDPAAQIGSVVLEELNLAEFGRNAIQTAKQIIIQRVREAERERIFEEFSGRQFQIESAIVQQISRGDIMLNLGRAEAAIPLREQIRRERYRQGDSVRGYIYEVLKSSRGPQVLLSRTHPDFLKKLFALEVPEIAEGIVEVHAVARDPGERAKIAVSSNDDRVDPVGACVGVKGSRVQAIVRELSGERIDIVPWSDESDVFIGRALSPAEINRVILDRRRRHATIIVNDDQLSLAIGKSGQNSKLAAQLTGWGIDIISEDEYQDRRAKIDEIQNHLRQLDGVSGLIALSLATSGFSTIASIAEASDELLQTVPGLEEEGASARLRETATTLLANNPDADQMKPLPAPAEVAEEEEEDSPAGLKDDQEPEVVPNETTAPALEADAPGVQSADGSADAASAEESQDDKQDKE